MKRFLLSLCCAAFLSSCVDRASQNQSPSTNSSPTLQTPAVQSAATPSLTEDEKKVADKIKEIVAKHLDLNPNEVDINTPLSKLKKPMDELDVVEIIMNVEEAFKIGIKDDEVGGGDISAATNITVIQLAEIVAKRKRGK